MQAVGFGYLSKVFYSSGIEVDVRSIRTRLVESHSDISQENLVRKLTLDTVVRSWAVYK